MRFDTPATTNPIDQLKVVGKPINRIDGPKKTTGTATYAYEWHDPSLNAAYGYVVGAAIAKGRISSMDPAILLVGEPSQRPFRRAHSTLARTA
jgi:xanthine dehydrogenase YagR molybdenum-binding subunit